MLSPRGRPLLSPKSRSWSMPGRHAPTDFSLEATNGDPSTQPGGASSSAASSSSGAPPGLTPANPASSSSSSAAAAAAAAAAASSTSSTDPPAPQPGQPGYKRTSSRVGEDFQCEVPGAPFTGQQRDAYEAMSDSERLATYRPEFVPTHTMDLLPSFPLLDRAWLKERRNREFVKAHQEYMARTPDYSLAEPGLGKKRLKLEALNRATMSQDLLDLLENKVPEVPGIRRSRRNRNRKRRRYAEATSDVDSEGEPVAASKPIVFSGSSESSDDLDLTETSSSESDASIRFIRRELAARREGPMTVQPPGWAPHATPAGVHNKDTSQMPTLEEQRQLVERDQFKFADPEALRVRRRERRERRKKMRRLRRKSQRYTLRSRRSGSRRNYADLDGGDYLVRTGDEEKNRFMALNHAAELRSRRRLYASLRAPVGAMVRDTVTGQTGKITYRGHGFYVIKTPTGDVRRRRTKFEVISVDGTDAVLAPASTAAAANAAASAEDGSSQAPRSEAAAPAAPRQRVRKEPKERKRKPRRRKKTAAEQQAYVQRRRVLKRRRRERKRMVCPGTLVKMLDEEDMSVVVGAANGRFYVYKPPIDGEPGQARMARTLQFQVIVKHSIDSGIAMRLQSLKHRLRVGALLFSVPHNRQGVATKIENGTITIACEDGAVLSGSYDDMLCVDMDDHMFGAARTVPPLAATYDWLMTGQACPYLFHESALPNLVDDGPETKRAKVEEDGGDEEEEDGQDEEEEEEAQPRERRANGGGGNNSTSSSTSSTSSSSNSSSSHNVLAVLPSPDASSGSTFRFRLTRSPQPRPHEPPSEPPM